MSQQYISVYLRNAKEGPSCYYRIMQYIDGIDGFEFKVNNAFTTKEYRTNINLEPLFLKRIYQFVLLMRVMYRRYKGIGYDIKNKPACIIISREIYPRFAFRFQAERLSRLLENHKVIWDFDDDIMASGEISKIEMERLEKYSDRIIVTHRHLGEILEPSCCAKMMVMPTTDRGCSAEEVESVIAERAELLKTNVNIAWVGTSSNLIFLEIVIGALDIVAKEVEKCRGKKVAINVVCNIPYFPKSKVSHIQIRNYRWSREQADRVMKICHVGIMPLRQSKFAEGKGAFKLIQYLSYGMPIIASPVGFNREVVSGQCGFLADKDGEWIDALQQLTGDISVWEQYAKSARDRYEAHFSYEKNRNTWQKLVGEMVKET